MEGLLALAHARAASSPPEVARWRREAEAKLAEVDPTDLHLRIGARMLYNALERDRAASLPREVARGVS
jgi:hypothetical protein